MKPLSTDDLGAVKGKDAAPAIRNGGFWRLRHDHLSAVLSRRDLSWESARVYLALADLTAGYGNARDVVSLGQIADRAGMDRSHVVRGLNRLARLGLCGQTPAGQGKVVRWVTWPPPAAADVGSVARAGNGSVAQPGSRGVAKGVAGAGTHQDTKKEKKNRREEDTPERAEVAFDESNATFKVSAELRQRWKQKYPGLDVDGEIARAGEYLAGRAAQYRADRRAKRPWTPAGYQRALVNWLNRAAQSPQRPKRAGGTFTPAAATPGKYAGREMDFSKTR